MKKLILLTAVFILHTPAFSQVGIGTENPDPSALLDLDVSSLPDDGKKGFLPPRMTAEERMNISSLENGLVVYNTTDDCINFYNGQGWVNICNGDIDYPIPPPINNLFGGSGSDQFIYSNGIITADDGFIIAVQSANSSANNGDQIGTPSKGGNDYWVIKFTSSGSIEWQKRYGGSGNDWPGSISQLLDGGYIVTGTSASGSANTGDQTGSVGKGGNDYWILKLDSEGEIQWQKRLGGNGADEATSVWATQDGGSIVAGFSDNESANTGDQAGSTGRGDADFWVVRLDSSGEILWQKRYGGNGYDAVSAVQQTPDNKFILLGHSNGVSANTGDQTGIPGRGQSDFWIVKLDEDGIIEWQRRYGGSGFEEPYAIQQTKDGGYIMAGTSFVGGNGDLTGSTSNGETDIWIAKLDSEGNIEWQDLYGGASGDFAFGVQETLDNGYIVVGYSNGQSANTGDQTGIAGQGANDWWILKLNATGNIQWNKRMGGSTSELAYAVQQRFDGSYYIVGYTASPANTGDLTGIFSHGSNDIWLVRLNENGEIIE